MGKDPLSLIYAPGHRRKLLAVAGILFVAIAVVDWHIEPYISLGFLYLFPIMIVGGFLTRPQIIVVALACAVLDFTNLPKNETRPLPSAHESTSPGVPSKGGPPRRA